MLARTLVSAALFAAGTAQAQIGTAFTYQGRLTDNGQPANGQYDIAFRLYPDQLALTPIGDVVSLEDVQVINGLFTVSLNFGPGGAFTGEERWIGIAVRPGSQSSAHTFLNPRQRVTPAPHAIVASRLALPSAQSGTTNMGLLPDGLLRVTQHGSAAALLGQSTGNGVGVYGDATGTGPAVAARNSGGGPALQISSGSIRVVNAGVGTSTPVFIHQATATNLMCNLGACPGSIIDHPQLNGDPNAIVLVTPVSTPSRVVPPVSALYDAPTSRWWLWANGSWGLNVGDRFNIMIVKP